MEQSEVHVGILLSSSMPRICPSGYARVYETTGDSYRILIQLGNKESRRPPL
jgi:hypothetical protein